MINKREQKKAALKDSLIEAAEALMKESGLDGLKAREIAAKADCALGSVYTAFKDLDTLALHVNLQTIDMLESALAQAHSSSKIPEEQLLAMAESYHDFAVQNQNLWIALFDHHLHEGSTLPDWYQARHYGLFSYVEKSLLTLQPKSTKQEVAQQAKTLFSAVHGIITINLQSRFISVSKEVLKQQLEAFILTYIKGIKSYDKAD